MKNKLLLAYCILFCAVMAYAQQGPDFITTPKSVTKLTSLSLASKAYNEQVSSTSKPYLVPNDFSTPLPTNPNALPLGLDPALQTSQSLLQTRAPIENFDGITSTGGGAPPDPTGAVGPNHYVQMVNRSYRIWQKDGTPLIPTTSLNAIFPGAAGDPIVLYDRYADRWLLSEFTSPGVNTIRIAISDTPDPTASYTIYEYQFDSFPDYFKFSIWHDGYYLTANKRQGEAAFVINRDALLNGDPLAQLVGFNIPSIGTSNQNIFSPGPVNSSGPELPSSDSPGMIIYFQDDSFSGISQDQLRLWEIDVDWAQTGNSTISQPIELPTEPFDTFFRPFGEGDIAQPGTSQRIDAVWGALMYQVQYRQFSDHNSIVLNHTVDIDDALVGGIRWYELRQDNETSPWSIFQQGTFSPDTESRFMGSIAIDGNGAIGLAYAVSGPNTFASLRYTGRFANDPLGDMTIAEQVIVDGTTAQTGFTRFGDYSQLTLDPTDDLTFWYTGEYFGPGLWRTRVSSFKISEDFSNDVGVSALEAPLNGDLSASEAITVTLRNYGSTAQSNFPVSYQIDGGSAITETFTGTIDAGSEASFTFSQSADFSDAGTDYNVVLSTSLSGDEAAFNNSINPTVSNLFLSDVGVSRFVGPLNDDNLNNEDIEIILFNYGANPQSGFDVNYRINGGALVTESFTATIDPETSASFTFSAAADLSENGPYEIEVFTSLSGDSDTGNDSITKRVINLDCIPTSTGTSDNNGCASDGFKNFELGTIKNVSGCNNDGPGVGYADFTFISTDLDRSIGDYDLTVRSGFQPEEVAVWIDFNDNGSFETSERVTEPITITQANTDQTFTLTIPSDAAIGVHTLRAKAIDAGGTGTGIDDPCGNVQWGETEDYTVNIVDQTLGLGDFTLTDNQLRIIPLGNQSYDIVLDFAFELSEDILLDIHNILGQTIAKKELSYENGAYKTTIDLSGKSNGVYLATIGNSQVTKTKKFLVK